MYNSNHTISVNNDQQINVNSVKTQQNYIKQEIKQESCCQMEMDTPPVSQSPVPHGVKRPGDPYEFEEEGGGNACIMDGFKRGPGSIKEESNDVKKITTPNLFTSESLQPSLKDLDEIFDNSDDTSSDEAVGILFISFNNFF